MHPEVISNSPGDCPKCGMALATPVVLWCGGPAMRIALIADIHANFIALEAVLQDTWACEADSLVCLGDIVGYGAQPRECTEFFRRLNCACLMGNHDFYTTSDTYDEVLNDPRSEHNPVWAGIRHARDELSDEDLA